MSSSAPVGVDVAPSEPSPSERPRRRRLLRWALAIVGVVVAAVVAAKVAVEVLDRADPVDVDRAVADFEAEHGSTDAATVPRGAFAPGAYRYQATGDEYIDLLGGPLHTFPDQVVGIVEANDCGGSTLTVQLFTQREDVLDLCEAGPGAWSLDRFETRHEFVGQEDDTVTSCEANELWTEAMFDEPDSTVEIRCTATGPNIGSTDATVTRRVHGREEIEVDGATVAVTHVEITSVIGTPGGDTEGTYENRFWVTDDGVIARRTLDAEVRTPTPVGSVSFRESFDLALAAEQGS